MFDNLPALAFAWPFGIFVLLAGLCVGSFLNVVVCRLPAGKSIVTPPSHCMVCQAPIAWYDNIPVVSYVVLGGRCRRCGAKFSARYMLVELATGLIFFGYWLALVRLGLRPEAESLPVYGVYMVLAAALLASAIIDFDRKEIYTGVTNFAFAVAVVASLAWPAIQKASAYGHQLPQWTGWEHTDSLVQSLVGAAVGASLITLTRFLGTVAFRKEAMGTGDAYMMAAIGAALGPVGAVLVFLVAPFMGLPYGVWQVLRERRRRSAEEPKCGTPALGHAGDREALQPRAAVPHKSSHQVVPAEEPQFEPPPVRIRFGAFLATVLGVLTLIMAAASARPEWNTRARTLLAMGVLACGLGFYLLGREEDRDREADEAAAREALKKGGQAAKSRGDATKKAAAEQPDDSHQVPYGPFLGAAAGLVMLIQDHVVAQFGPGIEGLWHAAVGA